MKITGNESANPVIVTDEHYDGYRYVTNTHSIGGMTIRQQFAMAAMTGFINTGCVRTKRDGAVLNEYNYESIAKSAVDQADALIKALNKEVPNG